MVLAPRAQMGCHPLDGPTSERTLQSGDEPRRGRIAGVSEHRFGAARYRVRATLRHRWSGYVALALMVALIGGLGIGNLAAARRTQSSFSTFIAPTNPSDLRVSVYGGAPGGSANPNYDPSLTARIARLPDVQRVAAGFELTGAPLTPNGTPRIRVTGEAFPVASVNWLYFSQDRVAVTAGRMAPPNPPDQIMMSPIIARQLGFHVGEGLALGSDCDLEFLQRSVQIGGTVASRRIGGGQLFSRRGLAA